MTRISLVTIALALTWADASAQDFTSTETNCTDLQLFGAAGVPNGTKHKYRFRGNCRELEINDDNKIVSVRWEGWVEVESLYDVATAELSEGIKVTMSGHSDGPASGTMQLKLKCAQDPMLTGSKCTVMQSQVKATWPDFVAAWLNGKPFTKGKVSLAQATALSKQSAQAPPPPPPPPPPAGKVDRSVPPKTPRIVAMTLAANSEIVLTKGLTITLQSGRKVAAQPLDGTLRWAVLGSGGEVLRIFPAGSRAYRTAKKEILVNWGGGTFNAGTETPDRRLRQPE